MGAGGGVVQDIRFARSSDGVRIAYAVHGSGPPLLVDSCWLSHLQFDWQSPVWRHYLVELGRIATVVRFDERGHGLSDRGVTDHSLDARVADLEAVADDAGLEQFAVLAMAQGGPVAIEYVARHPERVTRLAFYGSYAGAHADASAEALEMDAAFTALIRVGWDRPTPEFRRVFTSLMIPGGTEEQMRWIDDLQRMAVDADHRRDRARAAAGHRRQRAAARARPARAGDAQPRRPDERVRQQPAPRHPHPRRPPGGAGEREPHRAGPRTGVADVPGRADGVPRARARAGGDRAGRRARRDPAAVPARARRAPAGGPAGATTTPSAPSWCCRSARSSGTCRTRTPSSACTGAPPGPPRSPGCCPAPERYAPAPSRRRRVGTRLRVGADAREGSRP